MPSSVRDQAPTGFAAALFLFGASLFLVGLGQPLGIAQYPLSFLLKDHFGYTASQVALFGVLVSIPYYLKPLAGLAADTFLTKVRHSTQLFWASSLVILLWLVTVGLASHPVSLTISCLVLVIAIMFVNTVLGGLYVEFGQREKATGRLSAVRIFAEGVGVAVAGLAGGYLAGKNFLYTGIVCVLCFVAIMLIAARLRIRAGAVRKRESLLQHLRELRTAGSLWLIVLILFLVLAAPGLRTTILFFQTDHLHFTKAFIGILTFINGIAALLGALIYARLCRKLPTKRLLWFGIISYILSTVLYLAYRSPTSAVIVQAINGFALASAALPVLDLAARSCPKGLEATAFGLILSVTNIAIAISDLLGAVLYSHYHVNFYLLVPINLATTLLAVPLVMRLPASLVGGKDA